MLSLLFTISLLLPFELIQNAPVASNPLPSPGAKPPPKLVVFSFDAFRADQVNPQDTPTLWQLQNDGTNGHMISSFVTKTFPNHQSIATGLYEPYHGVINNAFIDPRTHQTFNISRPSSFWWDQFNISVPVYIANQVYQDVYNYGPRASGSMEWPGSPVAYTGGVKHPQRQFVHYLHDYDQSEWLTRMDQVIEWMDGKNGNHSDTPANCVFIYFPQPDINGHQWGPFHEKTKEVIRKLDSTLAYFLTQVHKVVNREDELNLIVLSDHGMAEVNSSRSLYLDVCEQLYPQLRYELVGQSPVFSIQPIQAPSVLMDNSNGNLTLATLQALQHCSQVHHGNHYRVFTQDTIPSQYHYKGNERILPLFLVADPGYDVNFNSTTSWRPPGYPHWGNHGYNNSSPSMQPLFIAIGERFKRNYVHPAVFENVDLYPLMLNVLGIPQELFPSNGTFNNVRDMLVESGAKNQIKPILLNDNSVDMLTKVVDQNDLWKITKFLFTIVALFSLFALVALCFVTTVGNSRALKKHGLFGSTSGGSSRMRHQASTANEMSNAISGVSKNVLVRYVRRLMSSGGANKDSRFEYNHSYCRFRDYCDDEDEEDNLSLAGPGVDGERSIQMPFDGSSQAKRRSSSSNDRSSQILTDIDWDIVGTGLDIDLHSQLSPVYDQSNRNEYLGGGDRSDGVPSRLIGALMDDSDESDNDLELNLKLNPDHTNILFDQNQLQLDRSSTEKANQHQNSLHPDDDDLDAQYAEFVSMNSKQTSSKPNETLIDF